MSELQRYTEEHDVRRDDRPELSHLSVEVGHFYLNDISGDTERVKAEFRRIVPLVEAFKVAARIQFGPDARISTCYLIDDYFQPDTDPAPILEKLLSAATESGLEIDYLARESGCATMPKFVNGVVTEDFFPVAEMVAARIVAAPEHPATGRRPPTVESGWLCNGTRSSDFVPDQAMRERPYQPPEEFGRREHSIFLDVELWSRTADGNRRWSCPFLATVWQLLRLGMLRYGGEPVVRPLDWDGEPWPDRWKDVAPIIRLNPSAHPFQAYRTLSMLPKRYISIEHAVRLVLDHLDQDEDVTADIIERAGRDDPPVEVSERISDRLSHLLLDGP